MRKNRKSKLAFILILLCCLSLPTFAKPPKVIKATPDNGEKNVTPSTEEIRIQFDQDMSTGGYSICGGGANYPKTIGKPKWIGKKIIVLKVKLEPNHKYELSINCPSYRSFRNQSGESAIIYPITFQTGSADSSSKRKPSNKFIISKLHEAIYAEETEGDLDKAIGLYEQVINQASEIERIAAKASYKLAMCYLKKDDKASAAKYFQSVVERYPSQRAYINKAKEQLDKITPQQKELPLFAQVPSDVLEYLSGQYAVIAAEGNMKNLKFNNHIYYVSPELKLFRGGYGYYQQPANSSTPERICFNGTTYSDLSFYDVIGNEMKVEIEDRPGEPGYYDIYWKPTVEIPAGQPFYYGWCRNKSKQLNPIANTNAYPVTMQNQYGSPVLEVFFLVLPEGFAVAEQSETFTKKETFAGFDIYQWKKEVPASTNHIVNVALNYDEPKQQLDNKGRRKVTQGNMFDILGDTVCSYLGNKYGEVCAEAGMKKLYSNSHVYFVDNDFVLRMGGMGYTYNWTGKPITENYRISGAKKTNLKYYDVLGNEMDIEIIPDKQRTGYYHVYWNPKEPLGLGEFFNFGWILEGSRQLSKNIGGTGYGLTMDNRFDDHCYETFFLVVPEGITIANQSEEYTKMKNFQGYDIYWWKKEVPASTNHIVNVTLKKETFTDKIKVYKINKSVADFADDDFSTPESAYAAINRVSASGKAAAWKKASVPKLADRLPGKDSSVSTDWAEVLRNAKIAEVRIYDNKYAQVTAKLLSEFSSKEIRKPFDVRHLELVDGKWLNSGNDRRDSLEETAELFERVIKRKSEQQEAKKPQISLENKNKEKIEAAVKSALDWLGMIDKDSYGESWQQAASYFKNVVTKKQLETAVKAARQPLGKLISREVLTKTYTTQVPGAPDGQYVLITFKASFENKKTAIETVTPMLDNDGKWKVSGYYIK